MNIQLQNRVSQSAVMSVLNSNYISEKHKEVEILAMGMAACQAKCLRCQHCSNQKCGNRS